jgi:hypothetical protein
MTGTATIGSPQDWIKSEPENERDARVSAAKGILISLSELIYSLAAIIFILVSDVCILNIQMKSTNHGFLQYERIN